MPKHRIVWMVDVEAASAYEAAVAALAMQRDPTSIATVFHVYDETFVGLFPEESTLLAGAKVVDLEDEHNEVDVSGLRSVSV